MHIISKIFFLFLCTFFLAACSVVPSLKKEESVTLKYWGLWESASTINQIISDYKKIKPNVDIIYEKKSPQQYRETLVSQIQSGKGPDIFRFHNTWTPMLESILAPVPSNVVSSNEFKKNFYPTVINSLRNSQKQFVGVPIEVDGLGLFWNEDIFKAAGINAPPTTWHELAQIATRITVRDPAGNIKTAGAALGTASNIDHFSDIVGLMIFQNGGDPKQPTDRASTDALEYYLSFARGESSSWDETLPSSTIAFVGGNLAMYFGPSWRAIEIKNANPLLKFKVAPVPQLVGGRVAWASYWVEGVSAKSNLQEEAFEFLKYLQEDATLIKLYSESAKSPGRFFGEPYPKVSMAAKLASDPVVGAYIADAPYMRSFPMASRTFDNGINDQIIKVYEDAINRMARGESSESALQTAAQNITSILQRFSSR